MKETCNLFDRGIHMITGEIKNKVDKIWENVWAAGLTNPLSVIEQITYLNVLYVHWMIKKLIIFVVRLYLVQMWT